MEVLGISETYWAIAIGMLGGMTSLLKDLFKTDALKKGLTIVGLFFVIGGAITAGRFHCQATYTIPLHESGLAYKEASGGAVSSAGGIYIVDDETVDRVFLFHLKKNGDELSFDGSTKLGKSGDDFEAAAMAPDEQALYLVTSHSNKKQGGCRDDQGLFRVPLPLEPDKNGEVQVDDPIDLRYLLPDKLGIQGHYQVCNGSPKSGDKTGMQIEGLAVDDTYMYIGLRKPLAKETQKAFIAKVPLKSLFTSESGPRENISPRDFEIIEVLLEKGGNHYGVVSLDYDKASGEILILGGAEEGHKSYPAVVFRWDGKAKEPEGSEVLPRTEQPGLGKQEVLLALGKSGTIATFIDGDAKLGAHAIYTRVQAGLEEILEQR